MALGRLSWRLRAALGRPAASEREQLFRLRPLRSRARFERGSAPFQGGEIVFVDGRSFYSQFKEIVVEGCYDFECDKANPRIVDCGANIGLSAWRFRYLFPDAEITVLEADPENAEVLGQNLKRWGDSRTQVIPAAAWSCSGSVEFLRAGGDVGRVAPRGGHRVPCRDIAEFCGEAVDLLKLDIEGGEYAVIGRLAETGRLRNVRRLACELHDRGVELPGFHEVLRQLVEAGLRYQFVHAASSPDIDPAPNRSGFHAVPYRGSIAMLYAWQE